MSRESGGTGTILSYSELTTDNSKLQGPAAAIHKRGISRAGPWLVLDFKNGVVVSLGKWGRTMFNPRNPRQPSLVLLRITTKLRTVPISTVQIPKEPSNRRATCLGVTGSRRVVSGSCAVVIINVQSSASSVQSSRTVMKSSRALVKSPESP